MCSHTLWCLLDEGCEIGIPLNHGSGEATIRTKVPQLVLDKHCIECVHCSCSLTADGPAGLGAQRWRLTCSQSCQARWTHTGCATYAPGRPRTESNTAVQQYMVSTPARMVRGNALSSCTSNCQGLLLPIMQPQPTYLRQHVQMLQIRLVGQRQLAEIFRQGISGAGDVG
jgi:hypothetical protein